MRASAKNTSQPAPNRNGLPFGLKLYKDDEVYGAEVDNTRHMWHILVSKSGVIIPDMGEKDAGVYVAPFLNLQEGVSLGDSFRGYLLSIPLSSWRVFDVNNMEYQFLSSRSGSYVEMDGNDVNSICRMMSLMECHLNGYSVPYKDLELQYLCRAVISTVKRYFGAQSISKETSAIGNRYADCFLRLVEKNCLKEKKLDFYARQLGISTKYLSVTISRATGKNAYKWISESVIEKANKQLRSTSSPIREIAQKVGFANCSDFCRFYKSNTGVSPQKYRRK